ncbi:hypothetical protein [Rhodococcus triatomae]|nr:hypothetical protein G419_11502 [Rhodococcus triatomae BKS 15-14]
MATAYPQLQVRSRTAAPRVSRQRFAATLAAAAAVPVSLLVIATVGSVPLAVLLAVGTAGCIVLADLMI